MTLGRKAQMLGLVLVWVMLPSTIGWAESVRYYPNAPKPAMTADDQTPAAGKFDYYLLSLSWSPAFCLLKSGTPPPDQCGFRRYGFVVHGLWPQYAKGFPSDCDSAQRTVPETVVSQVLPIMPSRPLIQHEWAKHGTCSGLSVGQYFAGVDKAFAAVQIPPSLQNPQNAFRINPGQLAASFQLANPKLPDNATVVYCKKGQLSEVRLCLDRQLQPRECSAEVLRGQCRQASILVPPVR